MCEQHRPIGRTDGNTALNERNLPRGKRDQIGEGRGRPDLHSVGSGGAGSADKSAENNVKKGAANTGDKLRDALKNVPQESAKGQREGIMGHKEEADLPRSAAPAAKGAKAPVGGAPRLGTGDDVIDAEIVELTLREVVDLRLKSLSLEKGDAIIMGADDRLLILTSVENPKNDPSNVILFFEDAETHAPSSFTGERFIDLSLGIVGKIRTLKKGTFEDSVKRASAAKPEAGKPKKPAVDASSEYTTEDFVAEKLEKIGLEPGDVLFMKDRSLVFAGVDYLKYGQDRPVLFFKDAGSGAPMTIEGAVFLVYVENPNEFHVMKKTDLEKIRTAAQTAKPSAEAAKPASPVKPTVVSKPVVQAVKPAPASSKPVKPSGTSEKASGDFTPDASRGELIVRVNARLARENIEIGDTVDWKKGRFVFQGIKDGKVVFKSSAITRSLGFVDFLNLPDITVTKPAKKVEEAAPASPAEKKGGGIFGAAKAALGKFISRKPETAQVIKDPVLEAAETSGDPILNEIKELTAKKIYWVLKEARRKESGLKIATKKERRAFEGNVVMDLDRMLGSRYQGQYKFFETFYTGSTINDVRSNIRKRLEQQSEFEKHFAKVMPDFLRQ